MAGERAVPVAAEHMMQSGAECTRMVRSRCVSHGLGAHQGLWI